MLTRSYIFGFSLCSWIIQNDAFYPIPNNVLCDRDPPNSTPKFWNIWNGRSANFCRLSQPSSSGSNYKEILL